MEYKCECGRTFEKSQSINSHYSRCAVHRNGKPPVNNRGGGGWNKGLSKETNAGVAKMAKSLSVVNTGKKRNSLTEEQKRNLSQKRIEFLEKHPNSNIKWFTVSNGEKEIKVQGQWEANVANWLNSQNVKWDRKRICYDGIHSYTPDFWLTELNFYIEVKGWLSDRDISKMKKVIDFTGVDIRLLDKILYNQLESISVERLITWNG